MTKLQRALQAHRRALENPWWPVVESPASQTGCSIRAPDGSLWPVVENAQSPTGYGVQDPEGKMRPLYLPTQRGPGVQLVGYRMVRVDRW